MVLTLMSNKARVAAAAAKAAAKAAAEAELKRDRIWREWNQRRETAAQEGRDFTEKIASRHSRAVATGSIPSHS